MLFWTKEEYKRFADEMMDKPVSYYAFQMLYWCGIREGELLALTAADFNFDKETVTINKSYQRLYGEDVITSPKTKKSNRTIMMGADRENGNLARQVLDEYYQQLQERNPNFHGYTSF